MPDQANCGKEVYWYGLAPDGTEAHDYDNFQEFFSAPVFEGRTLKEVWDDIVILSIDGCAPEDVLSV